jgi:hypothetical protein
MPFRSQSQRRFMYANHPAIARRWSREGGGGDLPEKVPRRRVVDALARKAGGK